MEKKQTYHEHTDIENTLRLRQVLATLPPFCRDYFRAIDATTTTKTRISYAYDIRIFFQFLLKCLVNLYFSDKLSHRCWERSLFCVHGKLRFSLSS